MLAAARAKKTTRRSRNLELTFFLFFALAPQCVSQHNRQKTEEREAVDVLAAVAGVEENAFHIPKKTSAQKLI